jgi:predicted nicotinamide N-methyase
VNRNSLWQALEIRDETYRLLNLEHPSIEQRILAEMERGIDVYYDRRWAATDVLADWLVGNRDWLRGRRILVLGAGVGAETLPLARHGSHIWINDLAETALDLCGEQLLENGCNNFTPLPGRYEQIPLPEVDLVVASFLIYNKDTLAAFKRLLPSLAADLILVNERLAPFQRFQREHAHQNLFSVDGVYGILIPADPRRRSFADSARDS